MALLQLPNELLTMVTNYLDIEDISRICRSCNILYQALDHILYRRVADKTKVLFQVIDRGQTRVVRKLLAAGTNPDQALFTYPFHGIVENRRNLQDYQMQLILFEREGRRMQRSGDLSVQPPSHFWTSLHLAASRGHNDIVNLLLNHGANVNALSYGFCRCDYMPKSPCALSPELPDMDKAELLWWMPLHTAICHKQYTTAYILVTRGASFQVAPRALGSSSSYVTALHMSSCTDAFHFSNFLLDYYKPPIDIKDHHGMSSIHWAYKSDRWGMVKWLVRHGADINTCDNEGCTVLLDACSAGRFSMALKMMDMGAWHDTGFKTTPLHCCCGIIIPPKQVAHSDNEEWCSPESDQFKLIKRLVEAGADVNERNNEETPLALAAERGLGPIIEYLLDAGAVLDARDDRGMTPLMRACKCGGPEKYQLSAIRILLQRGASVAAVDIDGRNAIEIVCSKRNDHRDKFSIVKLLLEYGSSHNAASSSTESLIYELYMSRGMEICEHLMKLNTRTPSKQELGSMILKAIEQNDAVYLQFALQFKDATKLLNTRTRLFDAVKSRNFESTKVGETPLDIAVTERDLALFEFLLDNGANPSPPRICGLTGKPHAGALFRAVRYHHSGIVEAIMRRDLFRLAPATEQIYSMCYLCNQDARTDQASNECLEALLRGGVDPNMPLLRSSTLDYFLPLQVAMAKKNQEVVDLLLKYGATPLE
ncbi:ankyrin [Daldinia caldariorum]|uniref:ankyrin n=1 Tax=Daldinia caldariorum TaxID=326644 RepID=UPI002007A45B|nr:ankyrin [Daldinia caldariorum]KAI1470405.1 ankyrin [Daldinia caldariorum]